MKRQILLWLVQRAIAATTTAAAPALTPPPQWRLVVLAMVAVGAAIGFTMTYAFGVALQGLFALLVNEGVSAGASAALVTLLAATVAGGIGYGLCALVRNMMPKPARMLPSLDDALETATGAVSDIGGLAVDLVRSFIEGLDDGKPMRRRRVHIDLDNDMTGTVVPIRRKHN